MRPITSRGGCESIPFSRAFGRPDANTEFSSYADSGPNSYTDSGTNSYADSSTNSYADSSTNSYADSSTNSYADSGTIANSRPKRDSACNRSLLSCARCARKYFWYPCGK